MNIMQKSTSKKPCFIYRFLERRATEHNETFCMGTGLQSKESSLSEHNGLDSRISFCQMRRLSLMKRNVIHPEADYSLSNRESLDPTTGGLFMIKNVFTKKLILLRKETVNTHSIQILSLATKWIT